MPRVDEESEEIQNDPSLATEPEKNRGNGRGPLDLPAMPSFSFADANFIVDIEVRADQLLAYIEKLTSLADRACSTALRQSEATEVIEKDRHAELVHLRKQLDDKTTQCHEQQLALVRLGQETTAQIAVLESQLRLSEMRQQQAEKDKELRMFQSEKAALASRLAAVGSNSIHARDHSDRQASYARHEIVDSKRQLAGRVKPIESKNDAIKNIEMEWRAKMAKLEQSLSETQAQLLAKDAELKEKDKIIQATAVKETEMGKLIKRLSSECSSLNNQLQEKKRRLAQIERKTEQLSDGKFWRRIIGRLQEEPQ
jgi:chromosome segregation ATPase